MFGENYNIVGHTTGKLDKKGRIVVPDFSHREKQEQLIAKKIEEKKETKLQLYNYKIYLEKVNRYHQLLLKARKLEKIMELERTIQEYSRSFEFSTNIDNQYRINIPNELLKELNWNADDILQYDGLGDSLLISKKSM